MKWVLQKPDELAVERLARAVGLRPVTAALLVNRGISDPDRARSFLANDLSELTDAYIFQHMEQAVSRIRRAVAARERIFVYGDYDVDGVTGSALMTLVLRTLGADVECYIPDRITEGYGLNRTALDRIRSSGGSLVISVDCGISAIDAASHARSIGLDLVITDHHELPGEGAEMQGTARDALPAAVALLHPALLDAGSSTASQEMVRVMTGVGVAFKLAQALLDAAGGAAAAADYLDLVTLGTIADVGKLTGENRVLVRHGLDALSSPAGRPGIAALKQVAGLDGRKITAGTVGFSLAPRINASGRMDHAGTAFRLLTTASAEEAAGLASALDRSNKERQGVEERILREARAQCVALDMDSTGALVLAAKDWHPGVVGIVASRIAEEFFRPAALISLADGRGKGSARSIPGFDLYAALATCADLLEGYGGHRYAAGFTVDERNIPAFRERLSSVARERIGSGGFIRTLNVDGAVRLADLDLPFMNELERIGPFGLGNPEPRLGARGLTVLNARVVGSGHLKLRLRQEGGAVFDGIAFKQGGMLGAPVREGGRLAAVFTPRLKHWNGAVSVELDIRDMKADEN